MEAIPSSRQSRDSNVEQDRNFTAVKQLRDTESQCELIRNRIKILKMNEQRNMKKIQNNQLKMEKLLNIRSDTHNSCENLNQLKKVRLKSIEEQKKKNINLKQSIISNLNANEQAINQKKINNYEHSVKQSEANMKKIESFKLQSLQRRQVIHKMITMSEQESKQNIKKFISKKTRTIHENQAEQAAMLKKKKMNKKVQIKQLEKIQMEMIKKYSESQQAFKNVKNKLDQMLGKVKQERIKGIGKQVKDQQVNLKSSSFYVR